MSRPIDDFQAFLSKTGTGFCEKVEDFVDPRLQQALTFVFVARDSAYQSRIIGSSDLMHGVESIIDGGQRQQYHSDVRSVQLFPEIGIFAISDETSLESRVKDSELLNNSRLKHVLNPLVGTYS